MLHSAAGEIELAPAYDLVCTELYSSLAGRFAMPIGRAQRVDELEATVWTAFARTVNLSPPFVSAVDTSSSSGWERH